MILAILQARMSSTRLPGKVLKPILGEPMLLRQVERVRRAKSIDRLMIATSVGPDDDALEAMCRANGLECFRGSLDDVLDRFYQAAKTVRPDHVMRLTGDCPLSDPEILDRLTALHLTAGSDYASTSLEPTFPDGLDAELMTFQSLETAWKEATLTSQREHVTPFLYQHPERFAIQVLRNETNLSSLRWTVDEPADYEFVKRLYEALYPQNPAFGMHEILAYLDGHPELTELNHHFERNAGYLKSLRQDASNR
ncbi:MAG TPA: glycosyltransferase family protein [Stenomitos sp.]